LLTAGCLRIDASAFSLLSPQALSSGAKLARNFVDYLIGEMILVMIALANELQKIGFSTLAGETGRFDPRQMVRSEVF